jgi:hypothetical protein
MIETLTRGAPANCLPIMAGMPSRCEFKGTPVRRLGRETVSVCRWSALKAGHLTPSIERFRVDVYPLEEILTVFH